MKEPRFDRDYAYGVNGELFIDDELAALHARKLRREDKRKRRADSLFYVELEHQPGRRGSFVPSGLAVTEADRWVYVVDSTGVWVILPTDLLRAAVAHRVGRQAEERDGSCPTRGRLIDLHDLLVFAARRAVA